MGMDQVLSAISSAVSTRTTERHPQDEPVGARLCGERHDPLDASIRGRERIDDVTSPAVATRSAVASSNRHRVGASAARLARDLQEELPVRDRHERVDRDVQATARAPPASPTISNVRLSGMPSRVKSSTRPRRPSIVEEQSHRAVERPGEGDRVTVIGLERERDRRRCTSTSRRNASEPGTVATSNGRGRSDLVRLDRAGDRPGELAILDPEPVHPPLEAGHRPRAGQRRAGSAPVSLAYARRTRARGGSGAGRLASRRRTSPGPAARRCWSGPIGDGLHATATARR